MHNIIINNRNNYWYNSYRDVIIYTCVAHRRPHIYNIFYTDD